MLSTRYHIATIIAIFFSLGIGILMGGTLGEKWMDKTETHLIDKVTEKYEQLLASNKELQKQISSLLLMNQTISPILEHKKIMWVGPRETENEILRLIMRSAGAEWMEKQVEMPEHLQNAVDGLTAPDVIIVSDPQFLEHFSMEMEQTGQAGFPKVIDVSSQAFRLDDPKEVVNLLKFLQSIMEENSHATVGIYRYTGLE